MRYVNEYQDVYQEEDLVDEDPEDIAELTKICVVNWYEGYLRWCFKSDYC